MKNEKKCDICKKASARIHIVGEGEYCFECHNSFMCEKMGVDAFNSYSKKIIVYENSGLAHVFSIAHLILGNLASWTAEEIDGEYKFQVIVNIDDDQFKTYEKLLNKIFSGINFKTLECNDAEHHISNALQREDKQYTLKDKGVIRIDEGDHDSARFFIDGEKVSPDELARMLTCFNGFNLEYQIRDISEDLSKIQKALTNEEKKMYKEQFDEIIRFHLKDSAFITYKMIPYLERELRGYYDVLKRLTENDWREYAVELGEYIKKKLTEIEHDDDYFPTYEIEVIDKILYG